TLRWSCEHPLNPLSAQPFRSSGHRGGGRHGRCGGVDVGLDGGYLPHEHCEPQRESHWWLRFCSPQACSSWKHLAATLASPRAVCRSPSGTVTPSSSAALSTPGAAAGSSPSTAAAEADRSASR